MSGNPIPRERFVWETATIKQSLINVCGREINLRSFLMLCIVLFVSRSNF